LIVGEAPPAVMGLVEMALTGFSAYFAEGALVSRRFGNMGVVLPVPGLFAQHVPVPGGQQGA
jgi:hypothetical protein